jgi:general stress protein 26
LNEQLSYCIEKRGRPHKPSNKIHPIYRNFALPAIPRVGLSLQGKAGILGKPPLFISIEAIAELVRDKALFEKHWNADLERWFEQGIETPGIVLIKAHAQRIKYWDGEDEGEVKG